MTAPQPSYDVTPEEVLAVPGAGWCLWRALKSWGMQWPVPVEEEPIEDGS